MKFFHCLKATVLIYSFCVGAAFAEVDMPLEVSLKPDVDEIYICEPLFVTLTVTNRGPNPIQLPASTEYRCSFVCSYNGLAFAPCNEYPFFVDVIGSKKIDSGDELIVERLFFVELNDRDVEQRFLFARPGTYALKGRVPFKGAILESKPVTLRVVAVAREHEGALGLLRKKDAQTLVHWRYPGDEGIRLLNELVHEYPDSPYADHARYALGRYFRYRAHNLLGRKDEFEFRGKIVDAAKRTKHYFSGVSRRIRRLRGRADYNQAQMLWRLSLSDVSYLEAWTRPRFDFAAFHQELMESAELADSMRLGPYQPSELRRVLPSIDVLFVNDERLDKIVTYEGPIISTAKYHCKVGTQQWGVPLSCEEDVRTILGVRLLKDRELPLREFMCRMSRSSDGKRRWIRRGDGYVLVTNIGDSP